ncbi:phage tail tape measure protein [Xenorhabdus sp. KK7.4]|nr:phage tail tape measure protein [Xenorhabdus sp. KK7.4]
MQIEELLVSIGVDTTQAEKIKDVVIALAAAATQVASQANRINQNLDDIGNNAADNIDEAGKKAEAVHGSLSKLKLLAAGVAAVVGLASAKIMGFLNGALAGAKDLAEQKGLLYDISKQELAQADEYQEAMKKTGLAIESIKTKIALNLVPSLTAIVKKFNDWIASNKELITKGLTGVIKAGGKVIQVITNSVRAVDKVISGTIGWKNALLVLAGVLAIVKRGMIMAFITNPVTWVIAAIAGVLLLLDDLMVYLDGGNSLFGDFWGACIKWIKDVKSWWGSLSGEMKTSIKLLSGMLGVMFSSNMFLAVTKGAGGFAKALKWLFSPLTAVAKYALTAGKAFIWLGRALLMNPIGLVVALIAGLIYVLYDLYQWITTGESAFGGLWKAIAKTWQEIKRLFREGFRYILRQFGMSERDADRFVDTLSEIFSTIWNWLTYPFRAAFKLIKGLYDIFSDDSTTWTQKLGKIFDLIWDLLTTPFKEAFKFVLSLFGLNEQDVTKFVDDIGKRFAAVKEMIKKPFKEALDWVMDYYNVVVANIKAIKDFFSFNSEDKQLMGYDNVSLSDIQSSINAGNGGMIGQSIANATTNNNNSQTAIRQGDVSVTQHITAPSPEKAANYANDGFSQALKNAGYNTKGMLTNGAG